MPLLSKSLGESVTLEDITIRTFTFNVVGTRPIRRFSYRTIEHITIPADALYTNSWVSVPPGRFHPGSTFTTEYAHGAGPGPVLVEIRYTISALLPFWFLSQQFVLR